MEGPSGVGKSSLVLAGVAPRLCASGWKVVKLRPGSEPLRELATALRQLESAGPEQRRLLIVDQLEEIFTNLPAERHSEQEQFVQAMWRLAGEPDGLLSILCTLRTDYRGHCASIRIEPMTGSGGAGGRRLDSLFAKSAALHNTYVQQMTSAQLQEVIRNPAELVGLELSEGLAERMLHEVDTQPGALALIQYTLDQLWQKREGRLLTQRAYDALGGVSGALNSFADATLAALKEEELIEAKRLLVQLVARSNESTQYTRRSVALSELRCGHGRRQKLCDTVLDKLVAAQLVVVRRIDSEDSSLDAEVVEVAHEALIRRWQKLQQWVRAEQSWLALRDQINQWVAEWQLNPQELLTPARLASAEQFDKRGRASCTRPRLP